MKSREEDLRKRGKFREEDINYLKYLQNAELMERINGPVAVTRSAEAKRSLNLIRIT